ncbi:hypothetical protein NEUTE1DRAFT_111896 [Neurospora tetrasperma FGSC 2508]|uniref:Uncharacterized protein n=1 Tax=Neurospora tetrasperma (strain FGSC 2508 / ATCC MYA-4615 / P0657) TaxID=510951 RepID=F8MTL9_NEUT8|nr:uncharacterized protein NEUTE1DRAFT_111896 [Neurospora tetrasperma FGSC 2508]EGO55351.1 hypothetical protein NEUTE1DRAFT_111896 [Neurospora tetrasperma FGSC 2508]
MTEGPAGTPSPALPRLLQWCMLPLCEYRSHILLRPIAAWPDEDSIVKCQPDLDTLTTAETAHAGVRNKLGIETEVGAVRLDLLANKGTELTGSEGLLYIDIGNHLLVRSEKLVTGQLSVVSSYYRDPTLILRANILTEGERALVLVGVLELSTAVNANDTTGSALDLETLVMASSSACNASKKHVLTYLILLPEEAKAPDGMTYRWMIPLMSSSLAGDEGTRANVIGHRHPEEEFTSSIVAGRDHLVGRVVLKMQNNDAAKIRVLCLVTADGIAYKGMSPCV